MAFSLATPLMRALSEEFHESCSAAILEDTEIVYVARFPARRGARREIPHVAAGDGLVVPGRGAERVGKREVGAARM